MTPKKSTWPLALAAILGIGSMTLTGSVRAHHSFAMFDFSKTVVVKGTVKEFRWTNPHVVLIVTGTVPGGEAAQDWTTELTSPGNLTRIGWTRHSFNAGDRVELQLNPLRDGKHGGAFTQATLLDSGKVMTSNLREAEKPGLN